MADAPADWYPDPLGRHEYRYWNGDEWTEHVADDGRASTDPMNRPAASESSDAAAGPDAGDDHTGTGGDADGVDLPAPETSTPEVRGPGPATATTAPEPAGPPGDRGADVLGSTGVRGSLLDGSFAEESSDERVALQNAKMLKVVLGPEVLARQGSMVAFQGAVDFAYEGAGGVGRFLKKAVTGEGVPLMRCRGEGELFLAHDADDVHLLWLDGGGLTVNGRNILAFEPSLEWDIERVQGASMFAGGLFNTVLRGHGWVAVTTHGTPVALRTDAPTYADTDAAVAWSADLETSLNRTYKAAGLIGRGSGEVAQLAFSGPGFVIVQASEGAAVPPHDHSS